MLTILFKEALKRPVVKADRIPGHLKEESIRIEENEGTFGQIRFSVLACIAFQVALLANANVRVVARILARAT